MNNNLKISIDSKIENVAIVRIAVSTFVSLLDIHIDDLMDIKTAVSEAVTNCIEHGYEDKEGIVDVDVNIKDYKITINIKDKGKGIEDIELATTATYTSKPEKEHAGLGFTIMESFMDEIIIDTEINVGTTITMKKEIKNKKS